MLMEFTKDKCCANCIWCFTEDDEMDIEGYQENDPNKPQAGDCVIGMDHGKNFVCEKHDYLDNRVDLENENDISMQKVYKK